MRRLIPLFVSVFFFQSTFSQEVNCSDLTVKQSKNGKYRLYKQAGTIPLDDNTWDSVSTCLGGFRIVYSSNKAGIVNSGGKLISGNLYDSVRLFWSGLASVSKNGKWGFINKNGEVVVNFLYDRTNDFIENVTEVEEHGSRVLINLRGEVVKEHNILPSNKPRARKSPPVVSLPGSSNATSASGIQCPENLDFENGNFQNWQTNIGSTSTSGSNNVINLPVGGWLNNTNTPLRQSIQDRNVNPGATDLYGGFSIHPPSGGRYSVKLGSDGNVASCSCPNALAEGVRYLITVPQNSTDYSILFSYAVVFENPNLASNFHADNEQPRFRCKLSRQNGQTIDCATFTFVASGPLPGFDTSALTKNPSAIIKYKDWSSVYVNLSGYPGENLYLEFATADCTKTGHFGYGYVDVVECGITGSVKYSCGAPNVATLTAPPGFADYKWYDNNFTSQLGTDQSLYLSNPVLGTNYKVIVTPYTNTGCPTCDCSDTLTLKVQATYPLANAGADKNICLSSSTTLGASSAAGVTYNWSPTLGLSNSSISNPIADPTINTQYILTATDNTTGCISKDTVDVSVTPVPVAGFTVNNSVQCLKGNTFQFNNTSIIAAGNLNYTWDFGDGNSSSAASPSHSYASAGPYTVTLQATSNTGCSHSIARQVTINNNPSSTFQINNSGQCISGNQFVFTTPSVPGISYTWYVDGQNSGNQQSLQNTFAVSGPHIIKLVATNSSGCSDSLSSQVTVYPKPSADFNSNSSTSCLDANLFTFANGSTITQGNISFGWNFGDGIGTSSASSPNYSYASPGNYVVTLKAISNYGCVDSIKRNVSVLANPVASFQINNDAQCLENNSFNFSNTTPISQGTVNYNWSFGDGGLSNQPSPTYIYSAAGSYNVRLIATSNNGCKDTVNDLVAVHPEPNIGFIINDASQCLSNNNFVFTNNSSISTGTLSYRWTFGDGSPISSLAQPSHTFANSGPYTVRLIGNSAYGCVDSAKLNVVVYPQPVLNAGVNNGAQCITGNNFTFNNTSTISSGTNAFTWHFGDGLTSSLVNPSHSYSSPGDYQVVLAVASNNGCIDTLRIPISVFAIPDVSLTPGTLSFCSGETRTLTCAANAGSGTIQEYRWYRNGVQIPGSSATLVIANSGNYTVKVINSHGCEKESAETIVVVNPLPTGDILPPSSLNICQGYNVHLFATPGYNYQWYFNGDSITSATTDNILATQPGTYVVKMTNQFGCSITSANVVVLKFVAKPVADFLFDQSCLNVPISFTNTSNVSATGPILWTWSFEDGGSSTLFNPQHTYTAIGVYDIKLIARSQLCTQLADSSEKEIKIVSPPIGVRYPTVNAVINLPYQMQARSIGTNYLWKPALGLNNAAIINPIFQAKDGQEYQIRIKLTSGCIVTDTVLVMLHADGDIFVPRAWSPNHDGHNDYLYPILVGMMELKMFRIFNRWGQLMFETSEARKGWNGIFNGTPQPNDTYTWTVEAMSPDGKIVRRSGNAVLMR